jgi:glutamyl/glutaminyl-tRNA synthetase
MVVTRFAPSPTGYLHIGGARTALFNWMWARKNKGKFILRIEDTDIKRNTPTATRQVIDDLRWLGIDWDEGPEVGGPNGPYFQSQRKDIYQKYVDKLIEQQKAYYCFDTPEQLEAIRQKAIAKKKNIVYPRPAKLPDESDVKKARVAGKPVTVRFAMTNEQIIVKDLIRGEVTFNGAELGDFIILKSDGLPTYNFAVVVDDALMGVTCVIRGQEHLMNTPGQQELWKALDFGKLPQYVHMSVTISESGGKLSKRERPKALRDAITHTPEANIEKLAEAANITTDQLKNFLDEKWTPDMPSIDAMAKYLGVHLPEINVVDFFRSGYLPETMVNFLALLGWSPVGKKEIMMIEELIESFDLTRLTKSNSLFDRSKLIAFNTEHIKMMSKDKLLARFKAYLKEIESPVSKADDTLLSRLLEINAGARTLENIENKSRFLFVDNDSIKYDEKAVEKVLLKNRALEILAVIHEKLSAAEQFNEQAIENMLRGLAEERQVGLGKVAQPLRVAICGTTVSPPIFDSVALLGKENTLARIDIALKKFSQEKKGDS